MSDIELAIIGGSGLYDIAEMSDISELELDTPFGRPSDAIIVGHLHGRPVAFLPRHGRGHVLTPGEVPYRANIYALKTLGVRYIVSVSACGSLREDFEPGHVVIPEQLFDFTKSRQSSFFGEGLVAHVSVGSPFSAELSAALSDAVKTSGGSVHNGGTFVTIEGPRFSTKLESNLFRQWGMSIIGMTTSPEAFLAAEAEIAYAVMAHVTDYDVWHEDEEEVSVELVIRTLRANTVLARKTIAHMVVNMDSWAKEFAVHNALAGALLTDRDRIPHETVERLRPIVGKYID